MSNWAIVIGIDEYWSERAHLQGAVNDAKKVREWLLSEAGGNVHPEQLVLLLSPRPGVDPGVEHFPATKDKIMQAINDLMIVSGGRGERLYFYFAGHGLTARVANRDEDALVTTGFNGVNTDHSIALRSLWEFFETKEFREQFFFVDACRNVPEWETKEFEIGRWTLPRTREPGQSPVQQFILYATSPGLKAEEVRLIPGEEHGAFTGVLLEGLREVMNPAKAWSWNRECYEVRWEQLADYVKRQMVKAHEADGKGPVGESPQIPQDSGSRGVADRDRNAILVTFGPERFGNQRLEVEVAPDDVYEAAQVVVLDGVGTKVAEALKLTESVVTFELPPKTYALRADAPTFREGLLDKPVELYEPQPIQKLTLDRLEPTPAFAGAAEVVAPLPEPRIEVVAPDPLTLVEIRDETGSVTGVWPVSELPPVKPGFYRVRLLGPDAASEEQLVSLKPGDPEKVSVAPSEPSPFVVKLGRSMRAKAGEGQTIAIEGVEPLAWAAPSTLVSLGVGAAVHGTAAPESLRALGLQLPPMPTGDDPKGCIGVYLVAAPSGENAEDVKNAVVRLWKGGEPVPAEGTRLRGVRPGLGEHVIVSEPGAWWLSIERGEDERPAEPGKVRAKPNATPVAALTVLRDRLTAVVVQLEPNGLRIYQYLPSLKPGPTSAPDALRRLEHFQRLLLAGRLDALERLAGELKSSAREDPFAGCLTGYALLRLGKHDDVKKIADTVIEVAPQLVDAYILRAEHAAATGGTAAAQSFAEAIGVGTMPLFGEGLTRLVEGVRAHDLHHPRAAIVRYIFQRHMRGSMWSVFIPRRFEVGELVVTGADTGYEA